MGQTALSALHKKVADMLHYLYRQTDDLKIKHFAAGSRNSSVYQREPLDRRYPALL